MPTDSAAASEDRSLSNTAVAAAALSHTSSSSNLKVPPLPPRLSSYVSRQSTTTDGYCRAYQNGGAGLGSMFSPYTSVKEDDVSTELGAADDLSEETAPSFARPEVFEDMVGDLRRTFIGWLKRTDAELRRERAQLIGERHKLKKDKERIWEEFRMEKASEVEAMREERRRLHLEAAGTMKQIAVERDDARRRLEEERERNEEQFRTWKRRLALEREQFLLDVEAFEEEKRRIADVNIAVQSMVELNVGGVIFETSRNTLLQQPGSLLEGIVSGRHAMLHDKHDRIFIDKDSELFRTILQFLRDPVMPPCPRDATESIALCNEAAYYGIKFFPFPMVFALGGHNGVDHMATVEFLDVSERCWRSCSSMETARTYAGYAELAGRILAFGGQNLDYRSLCDAECYDILRDVWTAAPPMNTPRKNLCGVSYENRVFAIGGFDGAAILSSVEAYDLRMKNWLPLAPLKVPRSAAASAVLGDSIWVMGGSRGERLRSVERYEPRMDVWETINADMLEVRSAACAAAHLGHIYVFGGADNTHSTHASAECFDPKTSQWHYCQSMGEPRMDSAAVVTTGSILVAGGQGEAALNSTAFFRPDLDEWKFGANLLRPRYGHGLLVANL